VEKSLHVIKEAVAVLPVFRHDRFRSKSVVEESLHVVFASRSVVFGARDDRFEP